jgi:hypothetical protein
MRNVNFRLWTNMLLLLTASNSGFAQTDGRSDAAEHLSASFTRYQRQYIQEKLFVHVAKSLYLAGEVIWFKAYDVDARLNRLAGISGVAYVELLDKDQKAVLQDKIELKDGVGDGSFRVPLNVPSGFYTLRAYTGWMKNFSPDFYFHQQLTILNTLTDEIAVDSPVQKDFAIRFFPEGGNLVNGIPSIVAFKAVNPAGSGVVCQGVILDQKKDTVARFSTARLGLGRFTFTPVRGNSYYALATAGPSSIRQPVPPAYDSGFVMHVEDPDGRHIRVTVRAASNPSNPAVYLLVHTHGRLRSLQVAFLKDNQAVFSIEKDSLDDGTSHITLFNSDRVPVCERLYCRFPRRRLDIGLTAPSAIDKRKKITVDISTADSSGRPVAANLSMSVFEIDSLQRVPGENILSYLLLGSDLKGKIESPQYYFSNSDPETSETLDDLMLTQGWTRFRWEDILGAQQPVLEFPSEQNGPVIHARLTDKRTGLPPSPTITWLTVPGRHFKVAAATSRDDGSLTFHLENFYGNKEIVLQTNNAADSDYRIEVSGPFSDRFSPLSVPDSLFSLRWKSQLLDRSIGVQADNAYRTHEKYRLLAQTEKDTTGFYGVSDLRYKLDDYVRFVTMDEVIREYVNNVMVRFKSGNAYFRVRNALFNLFFDDDPLLLIDGVPVFDPNKILALNPLKIERIDVVSHRYYFGPSITDGIVSFRSYEGDLGGYQLDPNAVVVQYNGLQEHREFYTPVYETAAQSQSPIPDFRNQLMWRPDITTGSAGKKQLSLYTSDLTGTFAIVVQGLAADGSIGYSVKKFTVQSPAVPNQ